MTWMWWEYLIIGFTVGEVVGEVIANYKNRHR